MPICFIYQIKNLENNYLYIGSTNNPNRRMRQHFSLLRNKKHTNPHLQAAFSKYGPEKFSFQIIEKVEESERFEIETFYLNILKPEYNIEKVATKCPTTKGRIVSQETKLKLSTSHLGIRPSEETRRKLSNCRSGEKHWNYGKSVPYEVKRKISEGITQEIRTFLSISQNKFLYVVERESCSFIGTQYEVNREFGIKKKTLERSRLRKGLFSPWKSNGYTIMAIPNNCN